MEIKSRYQIIAELEDKRRQLIIGRDGLDTTSKQKAREVRDSERNLADLREAVKEFDDSKEDQVKTFNTLINSITESLNKIQTQP